MKGWKTITGAIIIAAGAVLEAFGYGDIAKAIMALGGAIGVIGIGHKLDKQTK